MLPKINKKKPNSLIASNFSDKTIGQENDENFKVSFQYLDTTQKYGSGFKDWQGCGLLSKMMETLQGYSHDSLTKQFDGDKFALYRGFPKDDDTMFNYPSAVPQDARWARIHITGRAVVIGHIVGNTFYVVFLDKTHKFWLTEKDKERFKKNH